MLCWWFLNVAKDEDSIVECCLGISFKWSASLQGVFFYFLHTSKFCQATASASIRKSFLGNNLIKLWITKNLYSLPLVWLSGVDNSENFDQKWLKIGTSKSFFFNFGWFSSVKANILQLDGWKLTQTQPVLCLIHFNVNH